MASYQVQVVSSSPVGCVRNQQQSCRDSNGRVSRAAFKKNLKKFIREHLLIDENSQNHHNTNSNVDSWVADRRSDANRPCLRPLNKSENGNDENSGNHKLARVAVKFVDPDEATQSESQTPGASSLVQMWEARLKSIKSCSRTSSDASCSEIGPSIADPPASDASIWDETLSPDWEAQSEKTGASAVPCPGPSAKGEKERVRIADIIKRLKHGREENSGNEQEQEQVNNGESELAGREGTVAVVTEPRGSFQLQQIVRAPRLRGRQAFNNLLMQMQRERHAELGSLAKRQAVSKFPQRGRIQSLLRLRSLQRCNAIRDQCRNQSVTSRSPEHSNIKSIRERFSENTHGLKSKAQQMSNKSQTSEAACGSSKVEQTGDQNTTASFQAKHLDRLERGEDCRPSLEQELDIIEKDGDFHEPTRNLESQETKRDQSALSCSETPREREGESNGQHLQFLYFEHQQDTVVEAVTSWAEHEMMQQDEDDYEPCYTGNSYDWISEIARPKSYWEDLRKTWYEQALATSENEDIRQLLERKTVSTFLTSDFKERMDKLMLGRLQLEPAAESAYGDDAEEDRSSQVIAFLQRQLQPHDDQERQEEQQEEEISPYFVTPSLSIQLPSPFMKSWSNQDHNDEAEESDQLFSSSPSDSPPVAHFQVQSYRHNPQSSSSINHPSLEMELICDLKGQIEQLRSEMVELKKSVLSCIDLQMKMQQSMSTAEKKNTDSNERSACKPSCCMCHEMPVDSLLYRCGHMCTCMRCGQELQQNHRKCPVCKASIADVVQAYFDA